jgi:tRNA-dihydrouridine synthase B
MLGRCPGICGRAPRLALAWNNHAQMMLTIAGKVLDNRLILAPLAGYNDLAFRLLCREYGAALCVSEMISSHGLVYRQSRTIDMLRSCAEERPVSFQLFGADPAIMAEAAAIADFFRPDFIDINMGCPVRKVTKRGAGAALMGDIALAGEIIRQSVASTSCPVTIKIRSGIDTNSINAREFALMAEANGASAVAVHGRTWKQGFSGRADWQIVKDVKQAVTIPVIGNGDVTTYREAHEKIEQYGCDAVMIGRAAIGNPWVFGAAGCPSHLSGRSSAALRHLNLLKRHHKEPQRALGAIKNHLGRYFKGLTRASNIRREIYEISDWQRLEAFITELAESPRSDDI